MTAEEIVAQTKRQYAAALTAIGTKPTSPRGSPKPATVARARLSLAQWQVGANDAMAAMLSERRTLANQYGHSKLFCETDATIARLMPQWEKARQELATADRSAPADISPSRQAYIDGNLARAKAKIEAEEAKLERSFELEEVQHAHNVSQESSRHMQRLDYLERVAEALHQRKETLSAHEASVKGIK